MPPVSRALWFQSDRFEIHAGEDADSNPFKFGRELSEWLAERLARHGYPAEPAFPEDWGWCVMCGRKPFKLFVGCVNMHDYTHHHPAESLPIGSEIIWNCVVFAEQPMISRLFKHIDLTEHVYKLFQTVHRLLEDEAGVRFTNAEGQPLGDTVEHVIPEP